MKKIYLLFFILGFGLLNCSPKIAYYHGGAVTRHVDEEEVSWEYAHPELGFHSVINRWLEGVDTTDIYLNDARLPLKYRRRLFKASHPELLYAAQSAKGWSLNNYFLLAMVYSSPDTITVFQKKIEQSLGSLIDTYSVDPLSLDNGKKLLCHKYSFLKNNQAACHVASYYARWNATQIINIIVIDTDKRNLCHEVMFPIYGMVTNLFQE
jgi:hypothetical protein